MAEYDVSASSMSLGSGVVVEEDFFAVGGNGSNAVGGQAFGTVFSNRPLVNSFDGTTPDTLTIAVKTLATTGSAYGTISWQGHW
jgi:hypothetical protein